jgi:predicted HicB family RNase H-like nuclease
MAENPQERKRGRPPLDQPKSPVSTRLSVREHDRLIALAQQREMSVSALVRRVLVFALRTSC